MTVLTELDHILCDNIKELRQKVGLTQEELAKMLGVTPGAVSNWDNHRDVPKPGRLPILAQVFKVSLVRLYETEPGIEDELLDLEERTASRLRASFKAAIHHEKNAQQG